MMNKFLIFAGLMFSSTASLADTPSGILEHYRGAARQEHATFKDFSAERGKTFYFSEHAKSGKESLSCASCHSNNAKESGKTRAGKEIKPLAPSANAERFTDLKKVEKWFKRNCKDVLERPCSAQEKGDFISYILSIR